MRLHRFYTTTNIENQGQISVPSIELVNQVKRVFRMKEGDRVILFNGSGFDHECTIEKIDNESITFSILNSKVSRYIPEREVILCASIIKKDHFEWVVEKSTELGVSKIIPILSERSEKKSLNRERLEKIAIEASEQSGRGNIPIVGECLPLEKCLKELQNNTELVVFHTAVDLESAGNIASNNPPIRSADSPIAIFIGPEGGWTEQEIILFHNAKASFLSLGKGILRAETAAIVAVSRV